MDQEIWIISAKRTPIGSFQGDLASLSATELGAIAIEAALKNIKCHVSSHPFTSQLSHELISPLIDEVFMGCVLTAGLGQAPARQAALKAKLPDSIQCTTINKVCGSGLKAVTLAYDLIQAGAIKTAVAGGMESMTNAPYLLTDSRKGMRLGHKTTSDHLFLDGLQDAYEGHLMGVYAQKTADQYGYSRHAMDSWAIASVQNALKAQKMRKFDDEIIEVQTHSNKASVTISQDQHPNEIDMDKIPSLKPVFSESSQHGSVTAANSSAISDGAAALVLIHADLAIKHQLLPLAVIKGHTTHARKPGEFTIAPIYAIKALLSQLNWSIDEVDLWEINEAFAVVTQIAIQQLGLDENKVNINGGACALGHPIGASGARILVSLVHALQSFDNKKAGTPLKGIAAICIGGGEAIALAIEVPN